MHMQPIVPDICTRFDSNWLMNTEDMAGHAGVSLKFEVEGHSCKVGGQLRVGEGGNCMLTFDPTLYY